MPPARRTRSLGEVEVFEARRPKCQSHEKARQQAQRPAQAGFLARDGHPDQGEVPASPSSARTARKATEFEVRSCMITPRRSPGEVAQE